MFRPIFVHRGSAYARSNVQLDTICFVPGKADRYGGSLYFDTDMYYIGRVQRDEQGDGKASGCF